MKYSKKQIVEAIEFWQKKLINESQEHLHPCDKDILQHFFRYKNNYPEGKWTPVNVNVRNQTNQIMLPFIMWRNGRGSQQTDSIYNSSVLNWSSLLKYMSHKGLVLQYWNQYDGRFALASGDGTYACDIINDPQNDGLRLYRVFLKYWDSNDEDYPAYSPKWNKHSLYTISPNLYEFSKIVQKDYIENEQNFNNEKKQLIGLFKKNKITPKCQDRSGVWKNANDVNILKVPVKRPENNQFYYLIDTVKLIAYGEVDQSIDNDRESRFRKERKYLLEKNASILGSKCLKHCLTGRSN